MPQDTKISQLPIANTITSDDRLVILSYANSSSPQLVTYGMSNIPLYSVTIQAGITQTGGFATLTNMSAWTISVNGADVGNDVIAANGAIKADLFRSNVYTIQQIPVNDLPAAPAGARAFISNANVNTFGAAITGPGSYFVPAYFDGTYWRVG